MTRDRDGGLPIVAAEDLMLALANREPPKSGSAAEPGRDASLIFSVHTGVYSVKRARAVGRAAVIAMRLIDPVAAIPDRTGTAVDDPPPLGARSAASPAPSARRSGQHATTYRYWLLEPGGVQRRVELDPFKVVGRFTIAEQKNGKAASEAFKALDRLSK